MKNVYASVTTFVVTISSLLGQAPAGGPTVSFPNSDGSYFEGTAFCPNVNITNPDSDTTKVTIAVAITSTATYGSDFTVSVITMAFPPNFSGNQSFCIFTTDDPNYESIESIELRLRHATNGASINDSMYNAYIWDNDSITTTNPCSDLFFSEYIHSLTNGSRVLEIYNPTNLPVDLSTYSVSLFYNGSSSAGNSITLSGTLLPNSTFILANTTADPDVLAIADMTSVFVNFTGNDAIALYHNATLIDVIGIIGDDPGFGWPADDFGNSTASSVLVREQIVFQGDTDWQVSAANWDYYDQDSTSFVGSHMMLPCGFSGPTVFMLTGDAEMVEGAGFGISLGLANPSLDTTYVDVVVAAGSTANGLDFMYLPLTVKFPPGSTSQGIGISITDDAIAEPREHFTLKLTNAQNPAGVLMGDSLFFCRIYDNDTFLANFVCQAVFVSELVHSYGDGTRALEFFNPTGATINLSGYQVRIYEEGHTVADSFIFLSGSVASGDVFVIANTGSHPNVIAVANQTSASLQWSQHSVMELVRPGNLVIDQIGVKGEVTISGSGWTAGMGGSTGSSTLVRKPFIQQGQPWMMGAAHWDVYPQGDYTHLNSHTMDVCIIPPPSIGYATPDTDVPEDTPTVIVSVGIANPPLSAVTVDVVVDGSSTATSGTDVTYAPTTLTFPGGAPGFQTLTISINDDVEFEGDETLTLRLTNPSDPNVVFIDSVWTLTILDNDPDGITSPNALIIALSPNPAQDNLSISVAKGDSWDLVVMDMMGRVASVINDISTASYILMTESLTAGVYLVRVKTEEGEGQSRFVKE